MTIAERVEELIEEIDLDGALEMIDIFLSDPKFGINKRLHNLQISLDNKDSATLSKEAHILKGSSSNFEANNIMELSGLLELQGKRNQFEMAEKTFELLKSALEILIGELTQTRQKYI